MKIIGRVAALAVLCASPAHALCSYNGVYNAKTTIGQEFHDSKWVVKVEVAAADDHWSDEDQSWTIYHVKTLRSLKGKAPHRIDVFTFRDSGGFYLDKGAFNDIGGEYLLFLLPPHQTMPRIARGALQVNYSCGQSGPWAALTTGQIEELEALSRPKAHGR